MIEYSTIGSGQESFGLNHGKGKNSFDSVKYKLSNDKYLKILNYVNGIRELEKVGDDIRPTFIGQEGFLYFLKFPHSEEGYLLKTKNIKLSKDEKLNKSLIEGLEKRLK